MCIIFESFRDDEAGFAISPADIPRFDGNGSKALSVTHQEQTQDIVLRCSRQTGVIRPLQPEGSVGFLFQLQIVRQRQERGRELQLREVAYPPVRTECGHVFPHHQVIAVRQLSLRKRPLMPMEKTIQTRRLTLRKFSAEDAEPLFPFFADDKTNTFLPWFPLKSMEEAKRFYENRYETKYREENAYNYAVCLKKDNIPIGYINVSMDDSFDFGYGLRKEFWHQGIVTEAGEAVIRRLRMDGIPYITATHDINNPRSGAVMKRLGMKYQYSYEEQWQPKNFPVIFRLYQLNLDGNESRVFDRYWKASTVHFVEKET